jgi:hypothetical protein
MRHHAPTTIVSTLESRIHGIKKLFKLFVSFLKDAELIACEIALLTKKQSAQQ